MPTLQSITILSFPEGRDLIRSLLNLSLAPSQHWEGCSCKEGRLVTVTPEYITGNRAENEVYGGRRLVFVGSA